MVVVNCPISGCSYVTDDVDASVVSVLLTIHNNVHLNATSSTSRPSAPHKEPKADRPKVSLGITSLEWSNFERRWNLFRNNEGIKPSSAAYQLFQCAEQSLSDRLLSAHPDIEQLNEASMISAMKQLAVIPVATAVLRHEFLRLHQDRDETFRVFGSRVTGHAEVCDFTVSCPNCSDRVDFTPIIACDVLTSGIADDEIRREVLGHPHLPTMSVNDVVALVESKEIARAQSSSTGSSTISAISSSSYRRNNQHQTRMSASSPSVDRTKQAACPYCSKQYSLFSEGSRGWNTRPHPCCIDCYRSRRRRRAHDRPPNPRNMSINTSTFESESSVMNATSNTTLTSEPSRPTFSSLASVELLPATECSAISSRPKIPLDHMIFTKGEWRRGHPSGHPEISISIRFDRSAWRGPDAAPAASATNVNAVLDSGAQSSIWSLQEYIDRGFKVSDLSPVVMTLGAVNRSPISIEGAFLAELEYIDNTGCRHRTKQMVYVSSSIKRCYLSYDAMLDFGLLSSAFPDRPDNRSANAMPLCAIRTANNGCIPDNDTSPCSCPTRSDPPARPTSLPFAPVPENIGKMKTWLLETFKTSTFNTCPHQPLPELQGKPMTIHVLPHALPRCCHTAANIPIHWSEKVHADLLRDERLGVIERVPHGVKSSWCHRMVVTRKQDGTPRRTIDFTPLNKFCAREPFSTESPFHLARKVPANTWKTVTDAWNGYHSVPLRPEDRHFTTFITPFGRWRYRRAPQGYLGSGDAFNQRIAAALVDFTRKERCVDDTVHYDANLEEHWWRTIDYLRLANQVGIILNPDKFQFCCQEVDFAGFRISSQSIQPLPKYIEAIRSFPKPTNISDIRSWFGLVNQVAHYAQLRNLMTPFKPLLSPKCRFEWTPERDQAFESSKSAIISAIRHGVEIFDPQRPTCLRPDWSTKGIGYFLTQKHCRCPSNLPQCCPNGWRIVLAGSRFLSDTEKRYAPIEGESLSIAWSLEQTRYFTLGCDDLIIVTDHKPLVKIFGDRTLDEITNTRIFRLKQRTMPWKFRIHHMPGNTNCAADAASRHPVSPPPSALLNANDLCDSAILASIQRDLRKFSSLTWERLASETAADVNMRRLTTSIESGAILDQCVPELLEYQDIRHDLYTHDGVILYNDRVVVPPSLRREVLECLHSAHQGISNMGSRAREIIFWPGYTNDIERLRHSCSSCNRCAPSQAATPPHTPFIPQTPFEAIFSDYFNYAGHQFLVIGDRFSGWVEIHSAKSGTVSAGADGLVASLRKFFSTFGIPEELSSDGGPQFTSETTRTFLRQWGVHHRISSAHFHQSNGRAEVAVKAAKRIILDNMSPDGSLNNDLFLRAILQLRNTPSPDCSLSPAVILFGRPLRDTMAFATRLEKFRNTNFAPQWRDTWILKEIANRARAARNCESLTRSTRHLPPLSPGNRVFLQNQHGNFPKAWDRSGVIVEVLPHDQYRVRVDGSNRVTLRNRRFLRLFRTFADPLTMIKVSRPMASPTSLCPPPMLPTAIPQKLPDEPPLTNHSSDEPSSPSPPQHQDETPSDDTATTSFDDLVGTPEIQPPSSGSVSPPSTTVNDHSAVKDDLFVRRSTRQTRPPRRFDAGTGTWQ